MPIYEYECNSCGHIEEAFQKFSDKPLSQCRHCDGKLHKLISQSTFHLKGTGWYVTDYAKKSTTTPASPKKAKETPKESKSASATTSSSATSAD